MMARGSVVPQQVPPTSGASSFAKSVPGESVLLSPLGRGSPVNLVPKSTYRYLKVNAICFDSEGNPGRGFDFSTQGLRRNLRPGQAAAKLRAAAPRLEPQIPPLGLKPSVGMTKE